MSLPLGARHDAAQVAAFVAANSASLPSALVDIYVAYWVAGQSEAQIASLEGLSRSAIGDRIRRLRARVRAAFPGSTTAVHTAVNRAI